MDLVPSFVERFFSIQDPVNVLGVPYCKVCLPDKTLENMATIWQSRATKRANKSGQTLSNPFLEVVKNSTGKQSHKGVAHKEP